MPIYNIQGPDGRIYSLEGPEGATETQVIGALRSMMAPQAAPQPKTERSFGEAILDVPAAAVSGLGGLLQFPGQLVKLVPGLSGVGEVLEKPGELISEAGQALKSEGLKAREALRSKAISDAEKDGILSSFATAITSTIKDPALLTTFVAEQVPLLLGPASAAKVAQKIGAKSIESAGIGLTGAAAEEATKAAAQRVSRTAFGAAYGTGSAMQAADVSSDAYDEAYQRAKDQGLPEEQALQLAVNAGRVAGVGAGVTSLLAQRLPGARAIEQRLAGVPGTAGRLGSAVGESIGEAIEEGGGQVFKNIGLRQVTPDQPLLEGVGGAAGLGALGGGLLGGALGKKAPEERFEGQQEGESDRAFAARLQREIQQGIRPPEPPPEAAPPAPEPPPAGPTLPGDQQLFTLAAQPNGYGLLENLKQKLIADQSIPEDQKKPVIDNIGSIQTRMNIEQVERLRPIGKPPAPLLPTDEEAQQKAMGMDLNNLGTIVENMNKSIPVYQGVLANPESLKKEAKKGKLSVEEARSRYQEHIEYINSVLPIYTQVLQQRKQQQQQTKEAEKAQAIANLTPEQQAIRSQAESLIKELAESGVPEFVTSASGFQNVYNNNNFKTEKDIEFLKSKVESYRKLKQSAGAAKPVDEISLEFFNKDYPDDLARIQEASKDPRLADLFTRINDVMNRGAKAINALGMSWNGVDARSPLDIQEVKRSIGALGGGVGQLTKIKQAIDKNYDRSTNDPAKLERAITEIEADIETANQRIAKVQALAPAAAPTAPPAAPAAPPVFAAPPPEKVKKIEGPKPKGMPVRAKELPQPAAPVTQEQKEIKSKVAEIEKDIRKEETKRRSVIYRSDSLFKFLKNKLNQTEVNDVSTERQFQPLVRKGKPGDSISTFVANGDLDPWLPPDRRLGMTNYDEYDNTEYIKDLLRGGKATDLTFDAKNEVERIYESITSLERSIKDLMSVVEANEAANTAREEQRGVAEETGPTAAEIESQGAEPSPIVDEQGRVVRKSLAKEKKETVEIPPEIQKKIDLLEKVLRKNLDKFGLKGVNLNLEQGMTDEGSFSGQLIRIALDSPDPLGILRHESIHALKEAGFFTDKQWASLEKAADEQWIDRFLKGQEVEYEGQRMSRYDAYMKEYGGNTALIREEAIADAFRSFSKQKPAGLMGALTERMKNFFKAVKSAFNSQGIESADEIFGKIEEGKLEAAPVKAEKPAEERKSLRAPDTEAFKKWFGDSKVVDESGEPLVVYHGTGFDFNIFEGARKGTERAYFFSQNPELASDFALTSAGAYDGNANVMPVYLSIKNPLVIDYKGNVKWGNDYLMKQMLSQVWAKKYDGVIAKNVIDGSGEPTTIYAVIKPNQVKSATGNIGTFEPTSPDIRKSLRATETKAFDDWFKGSKIVDNNGKPRVMYHGTPADFDEFKPGSYVTTDPDYAALFGDRILPVYVSASKIKTILDEDFRMLAGKPKQIQKYIDAGFDALASDSGSGDLIILKPEQVKSAIGNVGTYNIYDKDIRKSLRSIPVIDPDIEARVNDTIQPRVREGFVDRMVGSISAKAFSYFREQLINHYNEFAEYDKRVAAEIRAAGGAEQMANEKAEVAALFSDQAAAVASSALGAHNRKGGVPVYRNGIVTVDTSGDNEGPVVIFAPLASTGDPKTFQHYQFWAAVNRAGKYFGDTTATRYKERLFEEADVKRAQKLYEDYLNQGIDFKDIQKRWNKYNNGLVKLMRDTGGISEAAARDFMLHGDYFPFYRQVNEEEMTGPKTFSTIAGTKPPKAATGGEAPLGDFFETVVRNTQAAITLAMKNVAAQRATSQALRINEVMRLSENPQIVQTGANTWDVFDSQYTDTIDAANEAAALAAAQKTYGANVSVSESPTRPGKWNIFKPVKIGDVDGADVQEARQRAVEDYKYRASPFVYKVLENGQPVYYRAADIKFINALKALNTTDLPFLGLLSAPANALRTLVTKEPGYMLVNQMRDSLSAWVTSGVKMTPVVDSARQFAKSIAKETPEMEALFNAGVIGGYEYAHGMRESGEFLEKQVRRKAGVKTAAESVTAPFTSLWGALERGTQISDGATRAEVYKRVLEETGNEAEALWQAAEVLNFYRHGRSPVIRVLTAAIPFLNSRIQGLDVLYRAGMRPIFDKMSTEEQNKRMKTFWTRGMTMMALSSMYWMLTHDDDEYKKQEQETRDNYWLIPSLGIKIAIPFEVGVIFKVLPERILENAFGSDTGKDTLDSLKRQLESTLMFTIIPQAFAPYIEVSRNFSSFTQRPIIGQGMEDISPRFQVAPGTSSLAQLIANKLAIETTEDSSSFTKALAGTLEISPIKLDHLIKGYTGTIGQYAVEVFDAIYNLNADVPKPSKRFEQMPIIKRLALDPDARGTVTSYYDLKNSVDEVVRTSNLLERTMKPDEYAQYLSQNMGILAHRDYVLSLEKSMKEFREMKTLIRNSEMTGDEKRDLLLTITQVENDLTANIRQVRNLTSK